LSYLPKRFPEDIRAMLKSIFVSCV